MTNQAHRAWPPWESISSSFRDSYKSFDRKIYDVGGEIWSSALDFAKRKHCDESTAYNAMMKAIASVSQSPRPHVKSLADYLFTAYKHLLFDEMKRNESYSHSVPIDHVSGLATNPTPQLERSILLHEIVAHMDAETLQIYEGLILGYSFEDLAKERGEKANVLRSKFSRSIKKISSQLNVGPVKLTA